MKMAHSKSYNEVRKIDFQRSTFDLSHSHAGSYDWGYLYPIMYEELSPGDTARHGIQAIAKMMPTIAPLQHEINLFTHTYFVPYRLLDPNWETFITGGENGQDTSSLPLWTPDAADKTIGSLWDHFGYPLTDCTGVTPIDYPKRAYNLIYNEYYRDENLVSEININTSHQLLKRAWEKDYFTASLPFQQRGIAPALPISGTTHAIWGANFFAGLPNPDNYSDGFRDAVADSQLYVGTNQGQVNARNMFNANTVDLSTATTFDVADIRAAIQLQRWMERNARAGVRYTEFIYSHFLESPTDERLQRPEYVGGSKQPIVITEVLQVSETATTPQGTRTGIGSAHGAQNVGTYHAQEYGILITIMSIMPRSMYTQGVNRMWLRRSRYDFLFPEFVNLSEQAVIKGELYASATQGDNLAIFGYQGRYDELRQRNSRAVGLMRVATNGLIHWNLSRLFAAPPALNENFIEVEIDSLKQRVFVVPTQPGFIVTFGNILTITRALPLIAEPGLMDHI